MMVRLLAIAVTTLLCGHALGAEFTLKLAHYLPPTHNHAANLLPNWAKRIEERSEGRIAIEPYPSGQLLNIENIFDGVRGGVADIGWGLAAANTGRFPRLAIAELPFQFSSAQSATRAVMAMHERGRFDDEFRGVRVLYLHAHGPGAIHTRDAPIRRPEDLTGLRIRFASPLVRDLLQSYGARPVGVPAPQVYENLEKGVIDGVTFPYEAMTGLRLGEQVSHHSDLDLYVLVFYLVMNERTFERLPEDLRRIILDTSGMTEALRVAVAWDAEDARARAELLSLGHEIVTPTPVERAAWEAAAQPVIDAYLDTIKADGIDGRALYDELRGLAVEPRQ